MPEISVIIPVYNVEKYLTQCLNSVLTQTFQDFEIICVNDGSTDNSLEILQGYAQKDNRIKIINQKNSGAGYSRNVGINAAQGAYLSFIDADDWIDEQFLEKVYHLAKASGADIVETTKSYNYYSAENIKLFNKPHAQGFMANGTFFRRDVIWDKLYKTDFIKNNKIMFPNGSCHNDAFFLLQSLYYKAVIAQDTEAVYWHNKANETSIRYKPSDKKLLSQLDMFILEIEFLNTHFFTFYDYRHNYRKLLRTAKRKRKYIQTAENKKLYNEKLDTIKNLNKYPFSFCTLLLKKLFNSRFREEMRNSIAMPEEYPALLKKWYFKKLHKPLNLENPQTFNEKIQWLKLYDSTPEKTILADKYQVRDYIRQTIGEEYLVPLLGIYSKFDDIDFDALPDKFVLKCNHGSAMNAVITNKSAINKKKLKAKFDNWMRENFGFVKGLQLHYNYIPHKIIAEEFIGTDNKYPDDFKIFCFNGKAALIEYMTNRETAVTASFFDTNWNKIDFKYSLDSCDIAIPKPQNLSEMIETAEKLSKNYCFVRVDLYTVQNKIYFGELTFTPGNGISNFPNKIDEHLGVLLQIPTVLNSTERKDV